MSLLRVVGSGGGRLGDGGGVLALRQNCEAFSGGPKVQ